MITTSLRRLAKREGGSAILEFAILAPLLVLLFAGLGDVSAVINAGMVVTSAARDGAFAATIADPSWQQEVIDYLNGSLAGRGNVAVPAPSAVTIACGTPPGSACGAFPYTAGTTVTVSVPVTVSISMPVIQTILGATHTVTGRATMEVSA